ncbi:MAG TPA: DMT family protein, partial [Myxococcota bacterium]
SLLVFIPFSILYMRASVGTDYFWACLCILGAVFFIFRSSWPAITA